MRVRGFTLVEIMLVVCIIGIGGSLAVVGMAEQVQASRARSDELGLVLKIKAERNKARERMQPVAIVVDSDDNKKVIFHRARIDLSDPNAPECDVLGDVVGTARFDAARLLPSGQLCLDHNGRPVGTTFTAQILSADGKTNNMSVDPLGTFTTSIAGRGDEKIDTAAAKGVANAATSELPIF